MQTTSTIGSRKSNYVYDYAIIGSGLAGLCVANALSRITSNVVLIESADTFGGLNRSIQTPFGAVNNGLRYLPDTELSQKAIAFLEMLLMSSLSPESTEAPAMTYEAGGLRPFVGFGNNPPPFYDEISYFNYPRALKTKLEPHEWTQVLFSHFTGEFMPRSYVTKFHAEGERITHLTVNGQKNIQALNFVYCGPVKSLKQLLPEGALSAKAQAKMSKNQFWTAVGMDLLHSHKVTDLTNMHILNGTTQDEFGPCVGNFHPASEVNAETLQYSQWLTFLEDEEAEDTELVGAALKKIKRQIKRVYPDALENLKFERILVVPSYSGNGELKLSANQTIPNLENLWVGSAQMSQQKNLLGALLQAEMITSAMGCHPFQQASLSEQPLAENTES
jgi:hypothetical protein